MSDGPNLSWVYAIVVQALGVLTLIYLVVLFGAGTWHLGPQTPPVPPASDNVPATPLRSRRAR